MQGHPFASCTGSAQWATQLAEDARRSYAHPRTAARKVVFAGDVTDVALSNSWIIINLGGGPTDDKPDVTLETPRDPNRVSSFLNIRVAEIHAVYTDWSAQGAAMGRGE